jgi:uncharacterized protein YuzE
MKLRINEHLDTVRIIFRENVSIEESDEREDGLILDLDADGHVIGIEVLNATARFGDLSLLKEANKPPANQHVPTKITPMRPKPLQRRRREESIDVYAACQ